MLRDDVGSFAQLLCCLKFSFRRYNFFQRGIPRDAGSRLQSSVWLPGGAENC